CSYSSSRRTSSARGSSGSSPVSVFFTGSNMRDLISISMAAISRYSAASSRLCMRICSTYDRYCRVTSAIGMSSTLKFCLRIRYSSRSSGPSKVSRNTSSASGGMYRSVGSWNSGSPYRRAKATLSTTSGVLSTGGSTRAARASPETGWFAGMARRQDADTSRARRWRLFTVIHVRLLRHARGAEGLEQLGVLLLVPQAGAAFALALLDVGMLRLVRLQKASDVGFVMTCHGTV